MTATVLVQSGHCYRTKGSTGTAGEQAFNAACADLAVAELRKRGYAAQRLLADPPLRDYRCDVFVAIHGDGSTSPTSHGGSVGWRNTAGKALAQNWKAAYEAHGWVSGWHADNYTEALHLYYGTGNALAMNGACRAIVVEGGFLTSPDDRAAMTSAEGHRRMALAIADAVDKTFGRKPPAPTPEDDVPNTTHEIADGALKYYLVRVPGEATPIPILEAFARAAAVPAQIEETNKKLDALAAAVAALTPPAPHTGGTT